MVLFFLFINGSIYKIFTLIPQNKRSKLHLFIASTDSYEFFKKCFEEAMKKLNVDYRKIRFDLLQTVGNISKFLRVLRMAINGVSLQTAWLHAASLVREFSWPLLQIKRILQEMRLEYRAKHSL